MSKAVMRLVGVVGVLALGLATAVATTPPNPQRPMKADTCAEALERVNEAALGSPLISAAENRQHLLAAVALAKRVCLRGGPASPVDKPPLPLRPSKR